MTLTLPLTLTSLAAVMHCSFGSGGSGGRQGIMWGQHGSHMSDVRMPMLCNLWSVTDWGTTIITYAICPHPHPPSAHILLHFYDLPIHASLDSFPMNFDNVLQPVLLWYIMFAVMSVFDVCSLLSYMYFIGVVLLQGYSWKGCFMLLPKHMDSFDILVAKYHQITLYLTAHSVWKVHTIDLQ